MAQVVLAAVGTAFGGPLGGVVGGLLGGVADRALVSALTPARQVGARLSGLELHSTSVGAPMAAVFGRARVAGQTLWAARFKEHRIETSTGGGKGGGATTVSYSYSLSFAVGLCEGPITGIGRVWATTAQPTGDGGFVLSGLLRGQLGSEEAMTGVGVGAAFVRLGPELARLSASASERGQPLLWRAAPAGGPPGGTAMSQATATWRARAWRPFPPAQLRGRRTPAGLRLTWVRRARIGGDSWEGEVPLEEPVERYRLTVQTGAALSDHVVGAPILDLAPADLTSAPYPLSVKVAQWGAMWGDWGGTLERTLLL